jgi:hypothetical protein
MSRWIRSLSGTNSKKPEVGLGVVGRKTLTISSPERAWISPRVGPVTKPMAPRPRLGYSTGTTSRKRARLLGKHRFESEHRFEDLLERAVDAAHDRHAREQPLAHPHQGAAGQARQSACRQGEKRQRDQQPPARQAERRIGLGVVAIRQQTGDMSIEKIEELPDPRRS